MDVDEHEVPEHDAHGGFGLVCEELEQRRHAVAHRFARRRHMHGAADIYRAVPVAGEIDSAMMPAVTLGPKSWRYQSP